MNMKINPAVIAGIINGYAAKYLLPGEGTQRQLRFDAMRITNHLAGGSLVEFLLADEPVAWMRADARIEGDRILSVVGFAGSLPIFLSE